MAADTVGYEDKGRNNARRLKVQNSNVPNMPADAVGAGMDASRPSATTACGILIKGCRSAGWRLMFDLFGTFAATAVGRWDRGPYHHHISGERVGQVSHGGVAISIRGLSLGAVSRFVAPVNKTQMMTWKENGVDTR